MIGAHYLVTLVRASFRGPPCFQSVDVASRARSFIHLLSVLAITFTCDGAAKMNGEGTNMKYDFNNCTA